MLRTAKSHLRWSCSGRSRSQPQRNLWCCCCCMNVSLCVFPLFSANKGLDDVIVSVFIRIDSDWRNWHGASGIWCCHYSLKFVALIIDAHAGTYPQNTEHRLVHTQVVHTQRLQSFTRTSFSAPVQCNTVKNTKFFLITKLRFILVLLFVIFCCTQARPAIWPTERIPSRPAWTFLFLPAQ